MVDGFVGFATRWFNYSLSLNQVASCKCYVSRLAYNLKPFLVNRLRPVGTFKHPFQLPLFYKETFSLGAKTIY